MYVANNFFFRVRSFPEFWELNLERTLLLTPCLLANNVWFLSFYSTHSRPLLLFKIPWKHQKASFIVMFSGRIKKPPNLWCFQDVSKSLLYCDVFRAYQKVSYIVMFSGRIRKSLILWCFHGVSGSLLYCDVFRAYQKVSYIVCFQSIYKSLLYNCDVFRAYQNAWKNYTVRSSHQRCSIKKLFLKISQYSQENTYVEVSF